MHAPKKASWVFGILLGSLLVSGSAASQSPVSCESATLKWVIDPINLVLDCKNVLGQSEAVWARLWLAAPCAPGPNCDPPELCRMSSLKVTAWSLAVAEVEKLLSQGFRVVNLAEPRRGIFGTRWRMAVLKTPNGASVSDVLRDRGLFCSFLLQD